MKLIHGYIIDNNPLMEEYFDVFLVNDRKSYQI